MVSGEWRDPKRLVWVWTLKQTAETAETQRNIKEITTDKKIGFAQMDTDANTRTYYINK